MIFALWLPKFCTVDFKFEIYILGGGAEPKNPLKLCQGNSVHTISPKIGQDGPKTSFGEASGPKNGTKSSKVAIKIVKKVNPN